MTLLDEPAPIAPEPVPTPTVQRVRSWKIDMPYLTHADLRPVKWHLYLAFIGLLLGVLMGFLQAMERGGANLYDDVPVIETYYQGLTLHGVALALVFTFSFANSFMTLLTMRGFGRPMASRGLLEASLWCGWAGTALAAWAILANKATVMFTFYAPLGATPAFYIGAVLLVVSTWLTLANQLLTLRAWRRDNVGARIPLMSYTSIVTMLMWFLASTGIAVEVLVFLLPWSLGLRDAVDPQFTRILFWFSGHPIVYFWLLPIYVSWYTLLPRQVGGKIYSDGLTRIVFLTFLLLLPVGVHHQFTDPGIPFSSKTIQWLLTFGIFFPSMVTAFSVVAALEQGGRKRGGRGWFGWITKLPWNDPSVAGQLLAGLAFALGGASGLINASYTVNLVVHNTSFIVGHFHLTVGTAVGLSIMAISYWMVPYLTGKQLFAPGLAVAQVWAWFIGVLIFARGQMWGGIDGVPRRTQLRDAVYYGDNDWGTATLFTAVGGLIMFVGGVLFFVVIVGTIFNKRVVSETQVIPVAEIEHGSRSTWRVLDSLGTWTIIAVVLSVVVYGEVLAHYLPLTEVSPPIRPW
ncbi:cbb3-type cytochrome c oxidase subunit I [Acidimicrobiia bacterium EGI L10123]|uniref:cbb3-type cytochrome c oxidase subunit I n=1 Tax=Salinilacustrithrix flava TaxID=2957203 RepID=UPI003D7C15AA|nr:cbb3-type cytochrome c oxidase subunit I [Acidimicrobiia bacterium EGI L10123]